MADTTLKFILESTFKGAGVKDASGALKDLTTQAGQTDAALVKTGNGFVALAGGSKQAISALDGLGISSVALTDPMFAMGSALKYSIDQAAEAEKIMAQTEAVIRSTGGAAGLSAEEIVSMSGALSQVSTFSDDAVQKGANLLLTFTGIGRDVFPEATKAMLDMATAMGTDASSGAIQLGKALNDPTAGITALTRVGVVFTDEQKNLIKSLQDTGDVAGAQRIILAELSKEFGGSAAAAVNTYSGKLALLQHNVDNLAESFGGGIIPILSEAVGAINTLITFDDKIKNALDEQSERVAETSGSYDEYIEALKESAKAAGYAIDEHGNLTKVQYYGGIAVDVLTEKNYALTEAEFNTAAAQDAVTASSATLTAETMALNSVWQSYGPTVSAAALANEELRQTLNPLTGAASDLKFGMGELTTATLFHQAAQGLDAEASYALAESMGMINKDSAAAKAILDELRTQLESGAITTAEYTSKVGLLNAAINSLPDGKVITIEMLQEYTQQFNAELSGQGGTEDGRISGATGDGYASGVQNMVVPPGYPNDSYPMRVQSGEVVDVWRSPAERASAMGARSGDTVNIYDHRAMALYLEDKRRREVERADALMG